ncbi:hypothetical protein AB0I49_34765 [Streptomyces sp. NPDC050617]|uniref:DUF7848 domain-containing protein n=1 Tax=Streptomyces sp. NPDC050617 TaxID=3154628 RepID=UPI0034324BB8
MKSTARAALARMMAESGGDGVLVVLKSGSRLGGTAIGSGLPPAGMGFPPCRCPEHLAGRGKPDTAIRLGDKGGGRNEVLVARPAYSAVCLADGDAKCDAKCGAESGELGTSDAVGVWVRQHADATGHRRYRRTRCDHLTLEPPEATAAPAAP